MSYLDTKDKIILEHLFQDGRLTTKELAKVAGITQPAAHTRLKRLEQEKFIQRYDAIVNYSLVHLIKKSYLCSLNLLQESQIKKDPSCALLLTCIGEYSHYILCWYKNKTQQRNFEKKIPKNRYDCILQDVNTKGPSLFDIPITHTKKQYGVKSIKLSKEDIAIIKAISQGGARKTLREIAKQTNLSVDIVHYRKKRLINHGYFSYFVAQPGFGKLHLTVSYLFINTTIPTIPMIARSPLSAITSVGVMITFLSKDIDDFNATLDKIYTHYRKDMVDSHLVTIKGYTILNRYPYQYILTKKN